LDFCASRPLQKHFFDNIFCDEPFFSLHRHNKVSGTSTKKTRHHQAFCPVLWLKLVTVQILQMLPSQHQQQDKALSHQSMLLSQEQQQQNEASSQSQGTIIHETPSQYNPMRTHSFSFLWLHY
jgi:hypothetical protein